MTRPLNRYWISAERDKLREQRHRGGASQTSHARQGASSARSASSQQPAEAEDRPIPGHRDGDLLIRKAKNQLATLLDFHNPKSPWQRGTTENTNRLLRQYFPRVSRLMGTARGNSMRLLDSSINDHVRPQHSSASPLESRARPKKKDPRGRRSTV